MKFHHVGHVTLDYTRSALILEALGYTQETDLIQDPLLQVSVGFWTHDTGPRIEVVIPLEDSSPVRTLITQRPGPYHYGFEVADLSEIESLKERTYMRALTPPTPAIAFDQRRVQFFMTSDGSIFELIGV